MALSQEARTFLDYLDAMAETVPFGNSNFQTAHWVTDHGGPGRAWRSILLNVDVDRKALEEAHFKGLELQVDLEEIAAKLADPDLDRFARRRLEIDRDRKTNEGARQDKLLRDAVRRIEALLAQARTLPALRGPEDFERQERDYWIGRLAEDAEADVRATGRVQPGTLKALWKAGFDIGECTSLPGGAVQVKVVSRGARTPLAAVSAGVVETRTLEDKRA